MKQPPHNDPSSKRPWTDPRRDPEDRVGLLLETMSAEEKLGQLGSVWLQANIVGINVAPQQDVFSRTESFEQTRQHGLGHVTRAFGTRPAEPADAARELVRLQRDLLAGTRLGIPAIAHEECLTGFTTLGATVFPTPLALAATFDPALVQGIGSATGQSMRSVGVHQGLAPVLDVVRDHRWGRVEETFGEDPYLVGSLGSAYVTGLQGAGVIATLKHYVGYSSSLAGRNHAPVHMGSRELREVMLLPFEMAVRAGVGSVMNSYSEIDGVPVAMSTALLTDILRDEWGFAGTVVSDYWAIAFLESMHRVADSPTAAGILALRAGLDVELPDTRSYGPDLLAAVNDGRADAKWLDRSAARVLRQKLQLGLLDAGWDPEPPALAAERIDLDPPAHRELARAAAERSIVLLSNDSATLPLDAGTATIALVGPCADDARTFFGCYSFPNHVLPAYPELGLGIEAPSLRRSLAAEFPRSTLRYAYGCSVSDPADQDIDGAVALAAAADVCIVAVGDRSGLFGHGTSGEGCDVETLELPGAQADLVRAVLATGTPTVLVAVAGRPYALGAYTAAVAAVVQSFFPGEEGGPALAGVLSGRVNPSGKLPVQVPRIAGSNPATYLHPLLAGASDSISNLDPTPEYPFGHGLSYTTFAYEDAALDTTTVHTGGTVVVTVRLRNTGARRGREVVQLYVHDPVASVTRPVIQLVGFAPVTLDAAACATVAFELSTDRLGFVGLDHQWIVEPGAIVLGVGASSRDLRHRLDLTVAGPTRSLGADRILTTPATVTVER